jgi:protoporphyrinogen oxidase
VAAGSLGKLMKRLLPGTGVAGNRGKKGVFFYPRRGFGQISDRLAEAAVAAGARIELGTVASSIALTPSGQRIGLKTAVGVLQHESQHLWSTIPVTTLVRLLSPAAPEPVRAAVGRLELRSMLLVYLVLDADRFTEFDAHYFPEADLPFTRVSEPKNYAALGEPAGRTVLCAEIPCSREDALWSLDDRGLGNLVADGLARTGLPVPRVADVAVRRLPAAYPVYRIGYEANFERVDRWVAGLPDVLSFGRQGLYAHDNTHHALYMARAAVECLGDGRFDSNAWARYRRIFDTHVVED